MLTDDERREVARRLRGLAKKLGPNMDAHEFAHYTADVIDVNECMTWHEMTLRLADLIEPDEPEVRCVAEVKVDGERLEQLAHDAAVELTGIDRDALLALEDEMFEDAIGLALISQLEENEELQDLQSTMAKALMDYARRIREALGVSYGD